MLCPDLTCVGLSDELGVDNWGLKIVKLVAFPDLIPHPPSQRNSQSSLSHPPSSQARSPLSELLSPVVIPLARGRSDSMSTSSSSSSEDDGYFSHSPPAQSNSSLPTSASRSYLDLTKTTHTSSFKHPSKHLISTLTPLSPIRTALPCLLPGSLSIVTDLQGQPGSRVPFFSFTRSPEGSSLTTDVYILAALFPPHERHMVICSGELDAADARNNGLDPTDSDDEDDHFHTQGSSLKCLQIDLRRFGLGE